MTKLTENEQYKRRLDQIENLRSTALPHQLKRLEQAQTGFRLGLATVYGTKLPPLLIERLVEGLILHPETMLAMGGSPSDLPEPNDQRGWSKFAKSVAEQDPWVRTATDHANSDLQASLAADYLATLSRTARMNAARLGVLDKQTQEHVRSELAKRAGGL